MYGEYLHRQKIIIVHGIRRKIKVSISHEAHNCGFDSNNQNEISLVPRERLNGAVQNFQDRLQKCTAKEVIQLFRHYNYLPILVSFILNFVSWLIFFQIHFSFNPISTIKLFISSLYSHTKFVRLFSSICKLKKLIGLIIK